MALSLAKLYKRYKGEEYVVDVEATRRLKAIPDAAPFVINVIEGSVTALNHDLAMADNMSGSDPLVPQITEDDNESVLSQLKKQGLQETGIRVSLSNSKRDAKRVTLVEAIRFFNTYEKVGVKTGKISTSGNSRGFYRIDALKKIVRGLGIRLPTNATKGEHVEAIGTFYTQNLAAINEDREARRLNVTLNEELGNDRV